MITKKNLLRHILRAKSQEKKERYINRVGRLGTIDSPYESIVSAEERANRSQIKIISERSQESKAFTNQNETPLVKAFTEEGGAP